MNVERTVTVPETRETVENADLHALPLAPRNPLPYLGRSGTDRLSSWIICIIHVEVPTFHLLNQPPVLRGMRRGCWRLGINFL
jgi:hypothetical protein